MKNIFAIFLFTGLVCQAQFEEGQRQLSIGAATKILPHITRADGGFKTTIVVQTTQNISSQYQLQPYDESGNLLDHIGYEGQISPGEVQLLNPSEIFPGMNVSHITLWEPSIPSIFFVSNGRVLMSARYELENGSGIPARVDEANARGSRLRTFAGDWTRAFDGLAVVNTGLAPTDVWLTQFSQNGQELKSIQLAEALAPMAKIRYILGDWDGSEFTATPGSYFDITGSQNLAAMALRGTRDGLLWSNHMDAVNAKTLEISPIFLVQPADNGGTAVMVLTYQHAESLTVVWDRDGGLDCGSDTVLCGMEVPELTVDDAGVHLTLQFTPPQPGKYNFTLTFEGLGGNREIPLEILASE